MTREQSWEVEGETLTILRHVTAHGYAISVFRCPSSLLGTRPAAIEMHAIDLRANPPMQHVPRVIVGEAGEGKPRGS
jgi:hypothetical protein